MLTRTAAAIQPTSSLRAGKLLFVRDLHACVAPLGARGRSARVLPDGDDTVPASIKSAVVAAQRRRARCALGRSIAIFTARADSLLKTDAQDGTLEQYVLSGQPLTLLLLAKTAAHWILTGLPLVLISPLVAVALGAPTGSLTTIMVGLALGTLTLSLLGAIGAALTIGLRRGSLLLSLLVLPLAMPLLIFGARSAELAIAGESAAGPLYLLASLLVLASRSHRSPPPPPCASAWTEGAPNEMWTWFHKLGLAAALLPDRGQAHAVVRLGGAAAHRAAVSTAAWCWRRRTISRAMPSASSTCMRRAPGCRSSST